MPSFEDTIEMVKHTRRRDDRDVDAIRQFLYQAPNVMYMKEFPEGSDGGVYKFISREWERTYDLKREEVIGKTDFDLFPRPIADKRRLDEIHTLQFGRMVTKVDLGGTRYNNFAPTRMALIPIRVMGEEKFTFLAGMALAPLANWQE